MAEIRVVPIGGDVSVRREIMRAREIVERAGLRAEVHATGTNVEGDLSQVLNAVRQLHEALHAEGVQRLSTTLALNTRIDKVQTLDEAAAT